MGSHSNLSLQEKKKHFRKEYRFLRSRLSEENKKESSKRACLFLSEKLKKFEYICSFERHHEEIDLTDLNRNLASLGKLILPRISGLQLQVFQVFNVEKELEPGPFNLMQPKADCRSFGGEIAAVLVPGIAFDEKNHRLGFGRGYYDRFLANHPSPLTIGIGFKEQFSFLPLPVEEHDIALNQVYLF